MIYHENRVIPQELGKEKYRWWAGEGWKGGWRCNICAGVVLVFRRRAACPHSRYAVRRGGGGWRPMLLASRVLFAGCKACRARVVLACEPSACALSWCLSLPWSPPWPYPGWGPGPCGRQTDRAVASTGVDSTGTVMSWLSVELSGVRQRQRGRLLGRWQTCRVMVGAERGLHQGRRLSWLPSFYMLLRHSLDQQAAYMMPQRTEPVRARCAFIHSRDRHGRAVSHRERAEGGSACNRQ